jgi:hypothetical protein
MLGPERPDGPHHAVLAAVAVADGPGGGRRGDLGRRDLEPVHGAEHGAGLDEQPLSGRRQRHPAARALEQGHAELAFELPDALRERRGGDVEPGRRPPEVKLLGDGHEVAQASHADPPTHGPNIIGSDMIRVADGRGLSTVARRP